LDAVKAGQGGQTTLVRRRRCIRSKQPFTKILHVFHLKVPPEFDFVTDVTHRPAGLFQKQA